MAVHTSTDLAALYRSDFKVFDYVTYMNTCSQGALADSVKGSFDAYIKTLELKGSAWGDWAGHQETVRDLLGKFFNVPANQIAVTTSASAGVASLASALDFTGKRNKVVTTDNEFPTIGQIWHAQEKRGAKVIVLDPRVSDQAETADLHLRLRTGTDAAMCLGWLTRGSRRFGRPL